MGVSPTLTLARRWWWLLLLAALVGGGVAYGATTLVTPTYQASATLLVVQQQDPDSIGLQDLQASERLANTFTELVTVRPVLETAIARGGFALTPDELRDRLSISRPAATQLLVITADASEAAAAKDLANAVALAFIDSNQSEIASGNGIVTVVESAEAPTESSAPNRAVAATLAAIVALLAAFGLVSLVDYLDDTVKDDDAVDRLTGLPVVGHVVQFAQPSRPVEALRAAIEPRSREAEAYRSIRTNLSYSAESEEGALRLVATSPGSGEGKSTTVANLAIVFGLAGSRVLVVDADLRRPSQHRFFGVPNAAGLSTLLLRADADMQSTVQRTAHERVWLLPSGPVPANPSELLGSPQTARLMDLLSAHFDTLIIDTPPALAVTDATILTRLGSTSIVIVRHGVTRSDELRLAVQRLAVGGKPIAGIVINRARTEQAHYYYARYEVKRPADLRQGRAGRADGQRGPVPAKDGLGTDQ